MKLWIVLKMNKNSKYRFRDKYFTLNHNSIGLFNIYKILWITLHNDNLKQKYIYQESLHQDDTDKITEK